MSPIDKEVLNSEQDDRWIVVLLTIGSLFAALGIGVLIYNFIENTLTRVEEEKVIQIVEEEESEDIQFEPINKIAYKSNYNIWVFDLETNDTVKITEDGSKTYLYTALAWRNKNELSYSMCNLGECLIQTYSFEENKVMDEFEIKAQSIIALRWSHKGEVLAYLYNSSSELSLDVKVGEKVRSLIDFPRLSDVTLDTNDAVYIRFSPNDEKILLVNTLVDGDETYIQVLNLSGGMLVSIKKDFNSDPTFPFFMSNDIFYYKKDDYLYIKPLKSGEETQLTDRVKGAFDFKPSPYKTKISYWTHDWLGGVSTVWTYEVGTEEISRIRDQESHPVWINGDTLVTLKTADCRECTKEKFEFQGLDKIDLVTKEVSTLIELEDIEFFEADNF